MAIRSAPELEAGLSRIREAPVDGGRLDLIVRRPAVDQRESVEAAVLDPHDGLVGDGWRVRGSKHTSDGSAHPGCQITLMNSRAAQLIAGSQDRWPLSGDQLFVDLSLGAATLPPGTRLSIGEAVLEISDMPHRGCSKFAARFGHDALRFVNTQAGLELNLRGIYARVIAGGWVRQGDELHKIPSRA
ncbi:MAG TPA: MOSC domain-containing protein [Candidatus Dormibacteraeota bacterium]|nr:MOSC domain-containing protein [Candidatus Dormibacteraeota bacterium]